ncbi:MAG: SAM-dependent methyltransferase, partial [Candidatus Limnocylindrales bacterium]
DPDDGRPVVGLVLANEVLDALPIHQVRGAAAGNLIERFVELGADHSFRFTDGPPSTPGLADRLARAEVKLAPGQVAEVCLALDGWVAEAAAGLSRGLLLAIDYGHPAAALYAATRGSLLRAYVHHRVHDDPFANIGRQDLTAHVDLTAVESAAARAGLAHLGTTTQAEFLAGLGVGDLLVELQTAPGAELGAYLEARSAIFRLLDPAATGRFAVLCFGRGIPVDAPLRGLSFRLPARS